MKDPCSAITPGSKEVKSPPHNFKVTDSISDITKNLIFYGTIAKDETPGYINSLSKKPPLMKLNIPISTKSRMNDIYNVILKQSEPLQKEKPSIISTLRQYTNRSTQRKINCSMEKQSSNKSRLIRARSQICSLLGEDDSLMKSPRKKKFRESDRALLIKTELNQILKNDNNKNVPYPFKHMRLCEQRANLNRSEIDKRASTKNDDYSYMTNDDSSFFGKNKKEGLINNTDLLFQLKLGLTKI